MNEQLLFQDNCLGILNGYGIFIVKMRVCDKHTSFKSETLRNKFRKWQNEIFHNQNMQINDQTSNHLAWIWTIN